MKSLYEWCGIAGPFGPYLWVGEFLFRLLDAGPKPDPNRPYNESVDGFELVACLVFVFLIAGLIVLLALT